MNDYIKSDLFRYYGKCNKLTFFKGLITNRAFRMQYLYRLCNDKGIKKYIAIFFYKIFGNKKFVQIPRTTKIGYGLYIGHGGPVIINPTAVIGNNYVTANYQNAIFVEMQYRLRPISHQRSIYRHKPWLRWKNQVVPPSRC